MAFKSYNTPTASRFVTIGGTKRDGTKNPDSIVGTYVGFYMSTFDDGTTKPAYLIKEADGINTSVNSNKVMVRLFEEAIRGLQAEGLDPVGLKVRIVFAGLGKKVKGKNQAKLYTLEFDPDSVDTSVLPQYEEDENEYTDASDDTNDDLGEPDEEPAEPVAASSAQLSAAERKAKVDEKLRKARASK